MRLKRPSEDEEMELQTMTKRNIWLIRHAQSIANQNQIIQGQGLLDTELTELGLKQAKLTAAYFKQFIVKNIYASDLKRAKQTAEVIANNLNFKIKTRKDLREAHFGKWEGCHSPTLALEDPDNYIRWMNDKTWRPDWCESFLDLQTRSVKALKEILSESHENTIIVTHGGLISALVTYFTDKFGKHPSINNCGITSLIQNENEQIEILEVNFLAPKVPISNLSMVTIN